MYGYHWQCWLCWVLEDGARRPPSYLSLPLLPFYYDNSWINLWIIHDNSCSSKNARSAKRVDKLLKPQQYYLNHNNPLKHYNTKKLPEPAYVLAPEVFLL